MITFSFNGTNFAGLLRVNSVNGRGIAPTSVSSVKVPGRPGVRVANREYDEREITVAFTVIGTSLQDLRNRLNRLSEYLTTADEGELIFSDEPDKTYYATAITTEEVDEIRKFAQGTITFLCADPHKYGVTRSFDFSNGEAIVNNSGTATAEPVFELEATEDTTYVDIFTSQAYMRVGRLPSGDTPAPQRLERLLWDELGSLTPWTASSVMEQGTVTGAMGTNGFSFQPNLWGYNETTWHGPAVQRVFPEAPLENFQVEVQMDMLNPTNDALGRIVVELLDESGIVFARMNVNKRVAGTHGNQVAIRAGRVTNGTHLLETYGDQVWTYKNFRGMLRIQRVNNRWEAYAAKVNRQTGVHTARSYNDWIDVENLHTGHRLAQIRVHIGQYKQLPVANMALTDLKVYRINTTQAGGDEVILREGDKLVIDHRDRRDYPEESPIRINGESAFHHKDFGASFFDLPKGTTPILIEPADAFTGRVWFKERYL